MVFKNQNEGLNNLPFNFKHLLCPNNLITQLPYLPANLEELQCFGNPLIYEFKPTIENIKAYYKQFEIL